MVPDQIGNYYYCLDCIVEYTHGLYDHVDNTKLTTSYFTVALLTLLSKFIPKVAWAWHKVHSPQNYFGSLRHATIVKHGMQL
jgi:hypothetical protein